VPKPSFEQRLQRLERRAFPKPGTIEYDRMKLAEARRKLHEAEVMEAAAEEPAPPPKPKPASPAVATASEPAPAPPSAPAPAAKPPSKPRPQRKRVRKPKAEPEPMPEPKPEPQWWEEKARWRQRGPEDYRWGEVKPNMCLVDYDPLAWFDDED
jgi:outer membrane biosynthesis protein TonB